MNGTKPFKFALRGVMDVTKRYKFICCGVKEGGREGGRTQRDPRDGAKYCLFARMSPNFVYLQGCPCRVYPSNADHGHLDSDASEGSM